MRTIYEVLMTNLTYRQLQANGITMNVAEQGEGPLVLLCHGFPETSYAWRHQIPALAAAGYHAVAPDLRGYGGSDRPARVDQYTLMHLVGDMVGLLDTLGAKDAVIVGNDWGATLAWQAALMRPDRFRGVVGIGVPLMGQPPMPPTKLFPQTTGELFYTLYFQDEGVAEKEFEKDIASTLRKILCAASATAGSDEQGQAAANPFSMVSRAKGLLASLPLPLDLPTWLSQADLDEYVKAYAISGFRGGLNFYRNLDRNWELQSALAGMQVNVPALYVAGEADADLNMPGMEEVIANMPALAPMLRDCIRIPECGHWVPQEKPEVVNKAIIDFLREL